MNEHLISVIVPIYNVEKYLCKCIESIINQTYKNLQIILVDDGSTDNSKKICDEYAKLDSRIKVIHKSNGGLISARKAGLKIAEGEFISNIDGDDWIESNMYEEMLKNILDTDADFVNSGVIYVYVENDKVNEIYDCNFDTCVIENPKMNVDIWKGFFYHYDKMILNSYLWSKLFKRKIFIECYENLSDSANYGEDRITLTEIILKCKKISFLKKCFYHYVFKREGSFTSKRNSKIIFWSVKMYEEIFKLLNKYEMYESLKKYLDAALVTRVLMAIDDTKIYPENIPLWQFDDINSLKNKKIIIYGAGQVGKDFYHQLKKFSEIKIVGWSDKNISKNNLLKSIDELKNFDYDLILIAVVKQGMAKQIEDELKSLGIAEEKILWKAPKQITVSNLEDKIEKIGIN